jgi:hypothetical protein
MGEYRGSNTADKNVRGRDCGSNLAHLAFGVRLSCANAARTELSIGASFQHVVTEIEAV